MKPLHWLLPETPDVLGLLENQLAITRSGAEAFAAWAAGDVDQAAAVRRAEHAADTAKRELQRALRAALVTPLEPEDLFSLSQASTGSSTRPRTRSANPRSWTARPTRRWPTWRSTSPRRSTAWPRR